MARVKFIGIRETLTSLLPKAEIERLARESGAMRRRRKSRPQRDVLVRGARVRLRGPSAPWRGFVAPMGVRQASRWCPSSFYWTGSLPNSHGCFRAVLAQLMKTLASSEVRYGGVLEGFRDVLAADATVIKLHRLLARRFPGTRTNSSPAAAKLHLVMSVRGRGVRTRSR